MSGPRLGDLLIKQGVIDNEKLAAALSDQRAFGGKLGRTLVDLGYVSEEQVVQALATQLGLETVDLATAEVEVDALSCLAVDACERYGVFPVRMDKARRMLWIATAEPERSSLQEVAQIAQYTLEPLLAPMSAIDRAIRQHYYGEKAQRQRLGEPLTGIPLDPGTAARPAAARPPATEAATGAEEAHDPAIGLALGAVPPTAAATGDELAQLRALVLRLEKTITAQGRAFRALVELMQEKGVVRRGELGQRTTKEKKP